jgi:hypothetical protein
MLVVGFVVGQLVARGTQSRIRSPARRTRLDALVAMVDATSHSATPTELADRAMRALSDQLDLRDAHWSPGYHGAAHPYLTGHGEIAGTGSSTPGRAPPPPAGIELPVTVGSQELGRQVLVPAPLSREEPLVAVAIADVFGLALARTDER